MNHRPLSHPHTGGHIPRKRFGQNFLQDKTVIHKIVDDLSLKPNDVLLEIGPGLGALTLPLLAQHPSLDVVEIDRDLVAYWLKQAAHLESLFGAQKRVLKVHESMHSNLIFLGLLRRMNRKKYASWAICRTTFQALCCLFFKPIFNTFKTNTLCCKKKWWTAWWQKRGILTMAV